MPAMAAFTCYGRYLHASTPSPLPLSSPIFRSPLTVSLPLSATPHLGIHSSFHTSPTPSVHRHNATSECHASLGASERELGDSQNAKHSLLRTVRETERGFASSPEQRAVVEEAMVAVEAFGAGASLDLDKLDGTWLLQYTTAADVLSIFQAAQLPFLKVGQIFQKFECRNGVSRGLVRNVVRWSVPGVLQETDGATLTVTAKFFVASARNIVLRFEEAAVGGLMVSKELQALLAPAFLPRTFFNLEVLQFIRGFSASVPLRRRDDVSDNVQRAPLGLLYYISFVDNEMLLGRALGSGGIFVFTRTQPLQNF